MLVPPESPLVLVGADGAQVEEACLFAGLAGGRVAPGLHTRAQAAARGPWGPAGRARVREPFEWEELGYIQGAVLIPFRQGRTAAGRVARLWHAGRYLRAWTAQQQRN
jgi:hypothetical protein